jgi:hypothetical protein
VVEQELLEPFCRERKASDRAIDGHDLGTGLSSKKTGDLAEEVAPT